MLRQATDHCLHGVLVPWCPVGCMAADQLGLIAVDGIFLCLKKGSPQWTYSGTVWTYSGTVRSGGESCGRANVGANLTVGGIDADPGGMCYTEKATRRKQQTQGIASNNNTRHSNRKKQHRPSETKPYSVTHPRKRQNDPTLVACVVRHCRYERRITVGMPMWVLHTQRKQQRNYKSN